MLEEMVAVQPKGVTSNVLLDQKTNALSQLPIPFHCRIAGIHVIHAHRVGNLRSSLESAAIRLHAIGIRSNPGSETKRLPVIGTRNSRASATAIKPVKGIMVATVAMTAGHSLVQTVRTPANAGKKVLDQNNAVRKTHQ